MPVKNARAYILLEALVGGALVAMVIGALYVQAGHSHTQIVAAARRTEATHLASMALEREIAKGYFRVASAPAETIVSGGSTYAREIRVTDGAFAGVRYREVHVEVRFPMLDEQKTVWMQSRVWAP